MGYLNFKKEVYHSPKCDPFYFCSVCGEWNNPFNYRGEEFEAQKKKNLCKSCLVAEKKRTLFDRRIGETDQIRNDPKAGQIIKRDSQE